MKIKVLFPNEKGKIELSKEELETLLEECYRDGLEEGKKLTNISYVPYVNCSTNGITYKSPDDFWSNSSVKAHMSNLEVQNTNE